MKLYYSESINPRKACAVARHVGAMLEYSYVDLGRNEQQSDFFLLLNANGKVPVLVDEHGSLWESNAIMCRLAQMAKSSLWPDGHSQAVVLKWLGWDAGQFTRFGGELYFERLIRPHLGLGEADPATIKQAADSFRRSAAQLNDYLARHDWLVDCGPTIADFAMGASLPYADDADIPFDDFPALGQWYARLCQLEGWLDPFPKRVMVEE